MELMDKEEIDRFLREVYNNNKNRICLFHGTKLMSVEDIAKSGKFIPQKTMGADALKNGYKAEDYLGYVFFSDCLENAGQYCSLACFNTSDYTNQNIITVIGAILPMDILLPDKGDAADSIDWKESLEKANAVSVKGPLEISPDSLFYLFIDYESGEILYLTSKFEDSSFSLACAIQEQSMCA